MTDCCFGLVLGLLDGSGVVLGFLEGAFFETFQRGIEAFFGMSGFDMDFEACSGCSTVFLDRLGALV